MIRQLFVLTPLLFLFSCSNQKESKIPIALSQENPFQKELNAPFRFDDIRVQHLQEVYEYVLTKTNSELQSVYDVPKSKRTFDNTMLAFDRTAADFWEIVYVLNLMSSVHPDDEIKSTSGDLLLQLSEYSIAAFLSDDYYYAIKEFSSSSEANALSAERRKYLDETLQYLQFNGLGLGEVQRERMRVLNDSILDMGLEFLNNIEGSGEEIALEQDELSGLSDAFIESLRKEGDQYYMSLNYSDYNTYMRDVHSERGREKVYMRFANIKVQENEELLQKIFKMRKELSQLLGYNNYSEYVLASNVMDTPEKVWGFLDGLTNQVRDLAIRDYNELLSVKDQVSTAEGPGKIEIWNRKYYENILKKTKYQVDVQELSHYFEIYAVVNGIFEIMEQLFGVKINEVANASKWHQDVLVYEVVEEGQVKSRIYLDLFSRENKSVGEFAIPISFASQTDQGFKIPSMCIATNFIPPTKREPTVLAHEEVVDLFTVFGFVLQHNFGEPELFSQNAFFSEKDFSYAPTSLLSNWAWEYDAIKRFARHYKTGEILDQATFNRIKSTRNVGVGIETNNQILFSAIDLSLHDSFDPSNSDKSIAEITSELENQISLFPHVQGTNLHTSFSHLSDYGSRYYMYLLSEVYGQDMYSVFKENGIFNQKIGKKFRNQILKKGVSEDEYEMVKSFLGREPNQEAYLNSLVYSN